MQLISESYDLLHRGIGLSNDELYEVFDNWDKGDLQSYLINITADIFLYEDDKTKNRLVDMILDKAGSKGTGKWTSQDAIDLPVPIPTIDMAVTLRNISSFKEQRKAAADLYKPVINKITTDKKVFTDQVHDALFFSILLSYAQGLAMIQKASTQLEMQIPLLQVVKIWRGGCIIRSKMLEVFMRAFDQNALLANLLLDKNIATLLKARVQNAREVLARAIKEGYPAGSMLASLTYFDAYLTADLPTNLIQAQRDYFGAHTYERIDQPGTFHTEWLKVKL
jgi:6-phosphogluconate dehydrogenase